MEAVIDTNIIQHTLRKPRTGAPREPSLLVECAIKGGLVCVADQARALIDEWRRTAGDEAVKQLVIQLSDRKALRLLASLGSVPAEATKALRQLGFDDTIDKLILRIAIASVDKCVVSEDSDFWDPSDTSRPGRIGDQNSPVARLLRDKLSISVYPLVPFMHILGVIAV